MACCHTFFYDKKNYSVLVMNFSVTWTGTFYQKVNCATSSMRTERWYTVATSISWVKAPPGRYGVNMATCKPLIFSWPCIWMILLSFSKMFLACISLLTNWIQEHMNLYLIEQLLTSSKKHSLTGMFYLNTQYISFPHFRFGLWSLSMPYLNSLICNF